MPGEVFLASKMCRGLSTGLVESYCWVPSPDRICKGSAARITDIGAPQLLREALGWLVPPMEHLPGGLGIILCGCEKKPQELKLNLQFCWGCSLLSFYRSAEVIQEHLVLRRKKVTLSSLSLNKTSFLTMRYIGKKVVKRELNLYCSGKIFYQRILPIRTVSVLWFWQYFWSHSIVSSKDTFSMRSFFCKFWAFYFLKKVAVGFISFYFG
jgi:hypothetical protein